MHIKNSFSHQKENSLQKGAQATRQAPGMGLPTLARISEAPSDEHHRDGDLMFHTQAWEIHQTLKHISIYICVAERIIQI